jgi:hypothetical protein
MWSLSKKAGSDCLAVREQLELAGGAADASQLCARGTLLAAMSEAVRSHIKSCEECRLFADEMIEVRQMLHGLDAGPQPGPFFMKRVMAAIADRETELERKSQTWAAVPKLAYRLSVLASLMLLIAGSWLYQQPRQVTVAAHNVQQSAEGLVDGGTLQQDDLLVGSPDR